MLITITELPEHIRRANELLAEIGRNELAKLVQQLVHSALERKHD